MPLHDNRLNSDLALTFQETLQLLICILLVGDFSITLLMLVQYYWISVGAFLAVLLIPPLALLSPFLAGLNALFSRGPKRSSVTRIFTLWNITSVINIVSLFFFLELLYILFPEQKICTPSGSK
jgi:hypothetical protein